VGSVAARAGRPPARRNRVPLRNHRPALDSELGRQDLHVGKWFKSTLGHFLTYMGRGLASACTVWLPGW
jgi:hypothetical protein